MKLASLNVEGLKHWGRINPFLDAEKPDVLCLQEVFEDDAAQVAEHLKMRLVFAPMFLRPKGDPPSLKKEGVAMLSRVPMENIVIQEYHTPNKELQIIDESTEHTLNKTIRRPLLSANIRDGGKIISVATTHFTWTPDGLPRDYQYAAAEKLMALLEQFPSLALCGDFNMPRGVNDIYERFAAKYHDAIPASYASSLDPSLHRTKDSPAEAQRIAQYMVDYLFLSNDYRASDVRLVSGVSDHCAIVATLDSAPFM
jgi:endonuclease/exonuclease/phosphatase family metal-dependent hydrolase